MSGALVVCSLVICRYVGGDPGGEGSDQGGDEGRHCGFVLGILYLIQLERFGFLGRLEGLKLLSLVLPEYFRVVHFGPFGFLGRLVLGNLLTSLHVLFREVLSGTRQREAKYTRCQDVFWSPVFLAGQSDI